jgi:hypothetical protein
VGREQAASFQFGSAGGAVRGGFQDAHVGEIGRVLTLEIDAAGDAGGPGSARIGAAALTQPASQIGRTFPYRHPGLMITGTGSQNQKSDAPYALQPGAAKIVQLDQFERAAPGSHDDVVLTRGSRLQ